MKDKPRLTLSDDATRRAVASIRRFFAEELDEDVGELKASMVLDYILVEHGPSIYNQAIADAKTFFDERAADLGDVCYHKEFGYFKTPTR
ncbi:MAG: DUF2164 domain-containing protein [Gemmatimonadaceae bacterium]